MPDISILYDSLIARDVFTNFQNTAPLCNLTTIGLELLESLVRVVQPLGSPLAPEQLLHTLVAKGFSYRLEIFVSWKMSTELIIIPSHPSFSTNQSHQSFMLIIFLIN